MSLHINNLIEGPVTRDNTWLKYKLNWLFLKQTVPEFLKIIN
jgi:hypothetical protein